MINTKWILTEVEVDLSHHSLTSETRAEESHDGAAYMHLNTIEVMPCAEKPSAMDSEQGFQVLQIGRAHV